MSHLVKIVDYGVGNIQAFMTMFMRLGIPVERARTADELCGADRLILPGVGAFDHAMLRLNESGMRVQLEKMVLGERVPLLGICVGMQMLANTSDEGQMPGLGWIPGRVRAFSNILGCSDLPLPHMGWNDLQMVNGSTLFSTGFDSKPLFYFLHSYFFDAVDKSHVAANANYGFEFDAAVSYEHIHGVQFHPEKSHHWGAQLFKNFIDN